MLPIEKKFVLTHIVKNVSSMKENESRYSNSKEHFGVPWTVYVVREKGFIGLYLYCECNIKEKWSISTENELRVVSVTGKKHAKKFEMIFKSENVPAWGYRGYIKWEEMEKDYMIDGNLVIEAHVKINKMTGIEKKKLRNFDVSMKKFSDIVLIVDDQMFYVSKLTLAYQSTYFDDLLLKNLDEWNQSEFVLEDTDPMDFQNFLELVYGESSIDDESIDAILKLAGKFDAQIAIRKCENFLIHKSEKALKEKLRMASQYNLEDLNNSCLSKINTAVEIRSVLTCNLNEMDPTVLGILLQKALALIP